MAEGKAIQVKSTVTDTYHPRPTQSAASRVYAARLVTVDPRFFCPTVAAVLHVTNYGLKTASDLVRAAPITIMTDLDLDAATAVKEEVEAGRFPRTIRSRNRKKPESGYSDPDSWPRPAAGEKCCTVEIVEHLPTAAHFRSVTPKPPGWESRVADQRQATPESDD
jgi:hypothetical protein